MRRVLTYVFIGFAGTAAAESHGTSPNVVTDVAPIHSLVSQVMGELGQPALLLPQNADPHHFQMRPSQARALAAADLVVWMGPGLTPWLSKVLENTDSPDLELLDLEEAPAVIEAGKAMLENKAGHDEEDDHDEHDGHEKEDDDQDEHNHGLIDPHAWLDPKNAAHYVQVIADQLGALDPANAAIYAENAQATIADLHTLTAELQAQLAPKADAFLMPYHNAYRYFFQRFGLTESGAILDIEGSAPSGAHISALNAELDQHSDSCLFSETDVPMKLVTALKPGNARQDLDPLGSMHAPGPDQYAATLRSIGETIANCK